MRWWKIRRRSLRRGEALFNITVWRLFIRESKLVFVDITFILCNMIFAWEKVQKSKNKNQLTFVCILHSYFSWQYNLSSLLSQNSLLCRQCTLNSCNALSVSTRPCSSYSSKVKYFGLFLKKRRRGRKQKNIEKNLHNKQISDNSNKLYITHKENNVLIIHNGILYQITTIVTTATPTPHNWWNDKYINASPISWRNHWINWRVRLCAGPIRYKIAKLTSPATIT